jgi:FkbM family methyltransferase
LKPRYIAFEPAPDEFACLRANAPEDETYNAGLWNSTTEIDFYVSTANADSSIIKPESYTQQIRISASRLDEAKIEVSNIDLIKLEAEGAEYEVIQGAEGLLTKTRYISADLGFERGGKSTLAEVTNFLTERDFEIVSFGYPRIVLLFKNKKFN